VNEWWIPLGIGLGAIAGALSRHYTTFSTYGLDTIKLLEKNLGWALAYGCGSVLVGILNVRLGIIMAAWFAQ
jgi:fluoride ion exporter CrcB/FEX